MSCRWPLTRRNHSQVDRLFAIWQAANPDGGDGKAHDGKDYWFKQLKSDKEQKLAGEPLYPFRRAAKTVDEKDRYWTPDRARDTRTFGYEYADTAGKNSRKEVREGFARKYGWSTRRGVNQPLQRPPKEMLPLDVCKAQVFQYTAGDGMGKLLKPLIPPLADEPSVQGSTGDAPTMFQEWYIDLVVERWESCPFLILECRMGVLSLLTKYFIEWLRMARSPSSTSSATLLAIQVASGRSSQDSSAYLTSLPLQKGVATTVAARTSKPRS